MNVRWTSGQRASGAAERVSLVPDRRCGCVCLALWGCVVSRLSLVSRALASQLRARARRVTDRRTDWVADFVAPARVCKRRAVAVWRCALCVCTSMAQAEARPARTVCDCRPKRRRRQDERRVLHFDGRGCLQLPTPGAHASAMRARTRSGPHTSIRRHAQRLQLGAGCWATTACASLGNAG